VRGRDRALKLADMSAGPKAATCRRTPKDTANASNITFLAEISCHSFAKSQMVGRVAPRAPFFVIPAAARTE